MAVRPNQKGMPRKFGRKIRLQLDDIMTRVRGDLTAAILKDKLNLNTLKNMHHLPADGNFCDEHANVLKIAIIQDCNRHVVCRQA